MKKNVWIFGGTGFIGRALVDALSHSTDYQLHLLVHKKIPYRKLEAFSLFTGSLESFNLSWLDQYPPDIIFHLARLSGSNPISRKYSSYLGMKANERIINHLLKQKINPVIIYVSGSLMYGNHSAPILEDSELNPVSYAKYYYTAEKPWIKIQSEKKLDVRFARPGWILGPDSWFNYFFWKHYLNTGKVPIYGLGSQQMSIIQVNDCARQIFNLAEKGGCFQNLNVHTGESITQTEFSETMAKILQCKTETISFSKTTSLYGRTVAEALTSSIPLSSSFPELNGKNDVSIEFMLANVISLLKNK